MSTNVGSTDKGTGANAGSLSYAETPSLNYYDPISQKARPRWAVEAVDELLVKIRKKNIWEVVDFCIQVWAKRYPKEHKQFFEDMKKYRKNRLNQYASTKSKVHRELVMIPPLLNYLLNKIAREKIMDYGEEKFKRDFAKRYQGFRPAEKI